MIIPFKLTEKWSEKYKSSVSPNKKKITEEFIKESTIEEMARKDNKGLKAEDDIIASTHHFEEGGTSSGRGSDAYVTHKSGKRYGVEIKSKGSAKGQTLLPHIRNHIDPKAAAKGDVISVRHRVKIHKSAREGKKGNYSTTAQLNVNHKHLSPSTHDITKMGKDYKKVAKKRTTKQ